MIHLVVSDQGHYSFHYRYAKLNREGGGKEQTNKYGLGSEGGSLCDTFVQLSVHLQAIADLYFTRNFHKATRNADSSLAVFSHCLFLPTVSFSGQLSQADCSLLPSFVNWLSLSSLGPSFPRPLPVSQEISPSCPLCGFRTKTKRLSDRRQYQRKWMLPIVSHTC